MFKLNYTINIIRITMKKSDEQKWQAESDASVLASYQEIINDKARMNRAVKAAQQRANDLSKRASLMQNAANSKSNKVVKSSTRRRK